MPTPEELRKRWQSRCEEELPPLEHERRRNAAITGRYVDWFRRRPHLLKFAGSAAFASRQVGRALVLHQLLESVGPAATLLDLVKGDGKSPPILDLNQLESQLRVMSDTNNRIFADLGWAHAAYLDPHGGLSAIEAASTDDPASLVPSAFRLIDAAAHRYDTQDEAGGRALVAEATELLLLREQRDLVQPGLDRLGGMVSGALTLTTWIDFDPDHAQDNSVHAVLHLIAAGPELAFGSDTVAAFLPFMHRNGTAFLQGRTPDFTRFEDRFHWAKQDVLKCWSRVLYTDPTIANRMKRFGNLDLV